MSFPSDEALKDLNPPGGSRGSASSWGGIVAGADLVALSARTENFLPWTTGRSLLRGTRRQRPKPPKRAPGRGGGLSGRSVRAASGRGQTAGAEGRAARFCRATDPAGHGSGAPRSRGAHPGESACSPGRFFGARKPARRVSPAPAPSAWRREKLGRWGFDRATVGLGRHARHGRLNQKSRPLPIATRERAHSTETPPNDA